MEIDFISILEGKKTESENETKEAFKKLYELYTGLQDSGLTKMEALQLIIEIFASVVGK